MSKEFAAAPLTIGQVNALVKRVGGAEKVLAILSGRLKFELVSIAPKEVVASATENTLTVKATTVGQAIAAGKYDSVNSDITESRFPITADQLGEWEWKLFEGSDSAAIISKMKAEGWEPAQTGHLLAFGEKYPDAQHKNSVIALGSVAELDGGRRVPELCSGLVERSLNLHWFDSSWSSYNRFLAVRKISKT